MCPQWLQIPKTSTRQHRSVLYITTAISFPISVCLSLSVCEFLYLLHDCCSLCLGNQARLKTHQQFIKTHQYSSKCLCLRTSTSNINSDSDFDSDSDFEHETRNEMPAVNLAHFNTRWPKKQIEKCFSYIFILFSALRYREGITICMLSELLYMILRVKRKKPSY